MIFLLSSSYFVDSLAQSPNSPDEKRKAISKSKGLEINPKINPKLLSLSDASGQVSTSSYTGQEDKIRVYIYLKKGQEQNVPKGIEILAQSDNIISAKLTQQQIYVIAELDQVSRIDFPISGTFLGHAVSEGVSFSFADAMQAAGFTGNNVKVAVIDSGFITANSEISANIVFTDTCTTFGTIQCNDTDGDSHGTAVAEIIVDMAPNVDLFLYATQDSLGGFDLIDIQNAIDDAISKNVDIISMSFGATGIGGDGVTGFEKDGTSSLSKKVNDAKNAGILGIVAVGNEGLNQHWQGTYSPSPVSPSTINAVTLGAHQSVMDFRPSQIGVQRACLPVNDSGFPYSTQWSDWRLSNQDYDFYLYDSTMSVELGFSENFQTGTQFPLEIIGGGAAAGSACLVIASFSSTQNHFFHIETPLDQIDPSVSVRAGSLGLPADATGALSVGAIDQSTDTLEAFSSSGPTDDSRNKPEICGPDFTLTHQTSLNPLSPGTFPGTSAATPHVAGAAALLMEKHPTISVDQLKNFLISIARFNASYSVNNLCGENSGAVDLSLVPGPPPLGTDVIVPIGTGFPGCETTSSCFLPFQHVINQGEQVTWYNDDAVAHTVTSGNPVDGPDGIFESFLILSGASFSHTFNSVGTFDYFSLLQPWMTGEIVVNLVPCSPPVSGDWTITSSCTLSSSSTAPGNVIVQNGAVLTIPAGLSLDIDFVNNFLKIEFGSGVRIKAGGSLT